jgi:hypothetical protein
MEMTPIIHHIKVTSDISSLLRAQAFNSEQEHLQTSPAATFCLQLHFVAFSKNICVLAWT